MNKFKDTLMPSKVTITVQSFEVDSSFEKIQKHCDLTHKQLSQFISHQFEDLIRKGERKWIINMDQFSELITKEAKQNICRFRLRVDVNKRVDELAKTTSRQKGILLSFLLYQVATQLEQGQKKRIVKKREERV